MSDPSLNKKASTSDVNEQLLLDKKSSDTEDNTEGKLKRDMQSGTVLSNKKTKLLNHDMAGGCGIATSDTLILDYNIPGSLIE